MAPSGMTPKQALLPALEGPPLASPRVETLVGLLEGPEAVGAPPLSFLDRQGEPEALSLDALRAGATRVAAHLVEEGVESGAHVLLLLPSGRDFVEALFGVFLAGGVAAPWPVPMVLGDPAKFVEALGPVVEHLEPARVITIPRLRDELPRVLGIPLEAIDTMTFETPSPTIDLTPPEADDPALVQYTSGPIGTPTGVVLTHRQILANVQGVGEALDLTPDDVAVSWIPLVHDMGLIGVLFSGLYWGYPSYLMAPELFLMRPERWFEAMSRFGGTVSAAPNFAYALATRRVRERRLEGLDLSRWRLALNGAEQVHPETIEAFAAHFESVGFDPGAFCPLYGLAENSLAVTCTRGPRALVTATVPGEDRSVVSVGAPVPGQAVAVVRPGTLESVTPGTVGEIVVTGPSRMLGYLHDAERTSRHLEDGWLHTGDLGFIAGGELHISGRRKEMVIKMGRNYYPSDVEAAAKRHEGIGGAVAFATPGEAGTEDLVVVVESYVAAGEDTRPLTKALSGEVLASVGVRADRIVLVPPGSLPADRHGRQAVGRALADAEAR